MSILLAPFRLIWSLASFVLGAVGRLIAILIGLFLMVLGVVITLTIVGAPVGIPLFVFGMIMLIRGIF